MTNEDRNTATVEMHDLPAGVQGLIQLGRNAIDRVSELERGIAERDETIRQLHAQLDEYERAPTVALLEWPAKSWPNLRLVSGAYATSGTSVELIARPTRKDGE